MRAMQTWLRLWLSAALSICGSLGCTFEDGRGFSRLESGSIATRLEPGPGRDLGNQSVLTNLGYRVHLDTAKLEIADVVLAELSGDDERVSPVVTMPIESELDWLTGESQRFERFEPSPELPGANVQRVLVSLQKVTLSGSVSGGPDPGGLGATAVPFSALIEPAPTLEKRYSWKIDRDAPEHVRIDVASVTDGTLFDGIGFAARVQAGVIALSDPGDADLALIGSSVAASNLIVDRK